MFGQDRVALAQLAPKLYEVQDGRCFYTQKRLDGTKGAEVDHFIAWARYPSNDPLNLVLASRVANMTSAITLQAQDIYPRSSHAICVTHRI